MRLDEIRQHLIGSENEDTVILTNPSYENAVIGITETGQLIYDYDLMVEHLIAEDKMSPEEAMEFIDYNTIRAIPYMGEKKPIIKYSLN